MRNLKDLIKGFEISDVRAAFYYLSRYLKQADYFEEYEKDFFEDDYHSVPSEIAKNLTFSLISFIEEKSEKKALEFNDEEYIQWMDEIDSIESKLDPEPSMDVKNSADQVIDELFFPEIGKSNK
ncbi:MULTISPECIES: hypothetical protein [Halomonadaceae]|uniref:hypothetical protein n=1 Tax=Halomonadaceae TaxID=28256 RepID=UPI00158378CD|nr:MULTISPECIES: hypothetical protein [Halomonas]MDI4638905.1 hypothetical protein [Halomonas sp. BMC7]NUJ59895.1 hypothetical protein [Halomonas taeanensis]|tara:strand:+ start:28309 stop:28680 length:372 start_codon:yes stop_codon:yes gene_type:complete